MKSLQLGSISRGPETRVSAISGAGQINYEAERALHYHDRVTQVLRELHKAGKLHLAGSEVTPLLSGDSVYTFAVAPIKPIFDRNKLGEFGRGIFSGSGITPDYQTRLYLNFPTRTGLPIESIEFANVPGFRRQEYYDHEYSEYRQVALDPQTAGVSTNNISPEYKHFKPIAEEALERLCQETGKPAEELVRKTRVLVYPEATLADLMADSIRRLISGRYDRDIPLIVFLEKLTKHLDAAQVELLQKLPEEFFRLYRERIPWAREIK